MRPIRRTFPVLLAFLALCGCGPKSEDEPTWLGCVASFSGADRSHGVALQQGMELAVDEAASTRVEGRRLAVVLADDRGSDETARAETVRLLAVNRVAALIGGPNVGLSLHVAQAAQPYDPPSGAPVVLPCDFAGPRPGDAAFTLCVSPAWRGKILARYAFEELKAKRAVVLTDGRNPVAVELASAFVKEWPRDEGGSVEQQTYQSDAEMEEKTAGVKTPGPADVVMIAAAAADFLKARRRLPAAWNGTAALYGGEDEALSSFQENPGDLYAATVYTPEALTDRGKEFTKKYQDRFHEAPDLDAALGYDAARLLFDALLRAKTAAAARVRDSLAATKDFDSLTGPLGFEDGRARRPVFVIRRRAGEAPRVVQRLDPEAEPPPER